MRPSASKFFPIIAPVALAAIFAFSASPADARSQIRIVGSSTVFPFSTVVAEQFGARYNSATPVVESTGTGGGLKIFCQGIGADHPDFTGASRAIKQSEIDLCASNGVTEITEIKIGYDGIVLANSREAAPVSVGVRELWLALAARVPVDGVLTANPYQRWSEIDPSLPNDVIEVYGPPPTSGTRDAWVELVMAKGCALFPEVTAITDAVEQERVCHSMRQDGAFIEAGENDNLIVQKLRANKHAFGIFGFSYLDQNTDVIQGALIDGVAPTFENIASSAYPVSRPLFLYVKNAHVVLVPGMMDYIAEFTSDDAVGTYGYLSDRGLIPLPDDEREKVREQAATLTPIG